eukprot:2557943-Amphidinium_carterae.1
MQELPWSLCWGDRDKKLDALLEAAVAPRDAIAKRIYEFNYSTQISVARINYYLKDAVNTLSQCSFSADHVEKMHASVALVKKHHPEVSTETLAVRAFVHGFGELLPAPELEDKFLQHARKRLSMCTLLRQGSSNIGARQVYLREVMAKRAAINVERAASDQELVPHTKPMALHGKHFNKRSLQERDVLQRRARSAASSNLRTSKERTILRAHSRRSG